MTNLFPHSLPRTSQRLSPLMAPSLTLAVLTRINKLVASMWDATIVVMPHLHPCSRPRPSFPLSSPLHCIAPPSAMFRCAFPFRPYPTPSPTIAAAAITLVSSKPQIFLARPARAAIHLLLVHDASPSNTNAAYPGPPSPLPSPPMLSPAARPMKNAERHKGE